MKREFGPSQSQEMIRSLVEAAHQVQGEQRGTLKLSKADEQFLKNVGVSGVQSGDRQMATAKSKAGY
jgi:hypothetical protein